MDQLTKSAIRATMHCLVGCAIGETIGMVIGNWFSLTIVATTALSVLLAFVFGYLFSISPLLASGLSLSASLKVALAADTVSITSMEIIDNLIMLAIPGAMQAPLISWLFWGSLGLSFLMAFVATVPVNRFLIARGKGHALAHQHHEGHNHDAHHNHHH